MAADDRPENVVQSCKTARTLLTSVLVTAPAPLREQLRHLPRERRAQQCAARICPADADRQTRVLYQTLIRLGQRISGLAQVAAELETQIAAIAEEMTPGLIAAELGPGALSAAQILLSWSHGDAGAQRRNPGQCGGCGADLADHLNVRLGLEKNADTPPDDLMVLQNKPVDRLLPGPPEVLLLTGINT